MNFYIFILFIFVLIISVSITFLSINQRKNAMETVNDMGMGWNLGNTFESYGSFENIKTPDDQIKYWGNKVPKRELFQNIKKYGFKTIRLPVTWLHFIDKFGNINSDWLFRVKEVVSWIVKEKMYCILNIHYDGAGGNWLSEGIKAKDKFTNIWTQLANEFKSFDEHLIFESMNDIENYADYLNVHTLNQAFIDTVRNSGGKNGDRLLIISGINKDFETTCTHKYKIPIDPSNKIAISMHYYYPGAFTTNPEDNPWTYYDETGLKIVEPLSTWGLEVNYKDMFTNFQFMKTMFIDKNIPVVITETGVLTEKKKEKQSIRDYLYFIFALSADTDGIMACLFDNSNSGEMRYYDREQDRWYDEAIEQNFKEIAQEKYKKPKDFFVLSNRETVTSLASDGKMKIKIGTRKVKKAIFNFMSFNDDPRSYVFGIYSWDKNNKYVYVKVTGLDAEKKFDGSYQFIVDVSKMDSNDEIGIEKWWGSDKYIIKYFTIELDKDYKVFNYNEYKTYLSSNYYSKYCLLSHIFIIFIILY